MKSIARSPAWVGVLATVTFAAVLFGAYLTLSRAIDLAIVTAFNS